VFNGPSNSARFFARLLRMQDGRVFSCYSARAAAGAPPPQRPGARGAPSVARHGPVAGELCSASLTAQRRRSHRQRRKCSASKSAAVTRSVRVGAPLSSKTNTRGICLLPPVVVVSTPR
jgi:hypothetical protein